MTEEEIFEDIRKKQEALLKKPTFYIHYDALSKKVVNFRNYLDNKDLLPYIEMTEADLGIPLDKFSVNDYRIKIENGKTTLEKFINEEVSLTRIDDFIYEIPKIETNISLLDHPCDLMIEQNNIEKEFILKLSEDLRRRLSLQSIGSHRVSIYVTATCDPNILYQTLELTLRDLIRNENCIIPFLDSIDDDVNMYALRYFQEYLHVVVKNEE